MSVIVHILCSETLLLDNKSIWLKRQQFNVNCCCRNITREMDGTPKLRREGDNGLFDISVMAPLPEDFLGTPVKPPTVFTCELKVPLANNYTVRKKFVYYAGRSTQYFPFESNKNLT